MSVQASTPLFSMVLLVAIGGTPWHCRPGSLARLAVPDDVGVDAKSNMEVSKPPCRRDNGEHVGSREPRSWPDDWPVIRPGRLTEPRRVSTGQTLVCVLCSVLVACLSTPTMFFSISLCLHQKTITSDGRELTEIDSRSNIKSTLNVES